MTVKAVINLLMDIQAKAIMANIDEDRQWAITGDMEVQGLKCTRIREVSNTGSIPLHTIPIIIDLTLLGAEYQVPHQLALRRTVPPIIRITTHRTTLHTIPTMGIQETVLHTTLVLTNMDHHHHTCLLTVMPLHIIILLMVHLLIMGEVLRRQESVVDTMILNVALPLQCHTTKTLCHPEMITGCITQITLLLLSTLFPATPVVLSLVPTAMIQV
mmetsp:Transcript_14805/g.21134  ORF Transcript_14805/g.21134 Transcript_14805/m.21134 type:complete len:215 (+) Transcript_14805:1865-2509(+)